MEHANRLDFWAYIARINRNASCIQHTVATVGSSGTGIDQVSYVHLALSVLVCYRTDLTK